MAKPVYDDKSITVMSELDHLRQNRGMYVGSTEDPNHLIYEVLDNSLDESSAKHANIVGVFINQKDHTCTISDNGRGIPFKNNTISTISTKLFSGGKFSKGKEGSAYGIAAGLHGIGLVAVCGLSDWMEVTIYRDDKRAFYRFENAKLIKEEVIDWTEKRPFSTQVSFKPTKKYFETLTFDIDPVRERMKLASVHIEHLQLILMVDGKREVINCDLNDYFKSSLLDGKTLAAGNKILSISKKVKDEELHISFCWDMENSGVMKHTGCVNLLPVSEGTHVNMTNIIFRDVFTKICEKEKLKYLPNDCFVGFRCHTNLMLYEPKYTSQTKEKLSVTKTELEHLYTTMAQQLEQVLDSNPELKATLLFFFDSYRRRLSANKNIIKGSANVSRYNQVIDSKLMDCTGKDVEHSELFIVEGTSAGGSATQCRDVKIHAILGLKGKIPNVAVPNKDFLKNKEIIEMVNCMGTGIEPDFNIESLRYGKVLFCPDGDADGSHICSLLMVVFLKLMPQLIKAGKVYRAIMPLYGAMVQKKFIPFYTDAELEKFKLTSPGIKIQRYKGLGEMNPSQLKVCLMDPLTRRLEKIEYPDNPEDIYKLMTDADSKRTLINED